MADPGYLDGIRSVSSAKVQVLSGSDFRKDKYGRRRIGSHRPRDVRELSGISQAERSVSVRGRGGLPAVC